MAPSRDRLALEGGPPTAAEPFPTTALGPADMGEAEAEAVSAVVRSGRVFRFLDPEHSRCAELEARFRALTGRQHALAVGGGTAALICGLTGIGVGEGDEVIVPGYTYIASAAAVLICGAVPVIAEIDASLTLDPEDLARRLTPRTKAVMPVHMRGIPCQMEPILEFARKHGLRVIEDVAQACGGSYRGGMLGAFGDAGCFSLQQFKVICAGEGGMVVTDDREVFDRAALRHDSAMSFWRPGETGTAPFPGANYRMNELEGALGCVQFDRMAGILARTRAVWRTARDGIADASGLALHEPPDPEGALGIALGFFLDAPAKAKRFAEALQAEGVPAGSIYDKGIPDRHIYCHWDYVMHKTSPHASGWPWTSPKHDPNRAYSPDMCPRTLDILGRAVVIPIGHKFEDRHAAWIIEAVHKVARALARS